MKKIYSLLFFSLFLFIKLVAQDNYIDSLKQQLVIAKEDTNKVNLLINLSWAYIWSFADTAVTYAQKGLELSKELKYKEGEGSSMNALCISLTVTGNFNNALDFGFKAIQVVENLHDTSGIISDDVALELCYRDQGDYNQALVYAYRAKNLYELAHYTWNERVILGNISSIYEKNNQLDSALYYGNKTYGLTKEWSGILQTLGNIHAKLGHNELSLDYYRKGIIVATQSHAYKDLIDIYNGISKVFESADNTDSAIYYADKSISAEGVNSYPTGILEASKQLAHLYELKKNNDSVAKYLKLTISFNDSLFSKQKTREAQNFLFNEKLHQQELTAKEQEDKSKIKLYVLLGLTGIFLVIGFFLWRNNQHKQKANALLKQQKEKVESTLQELESTQAQLIQSEKMASLGELTAGIAHEIQNPLNFVNNFSEVNTELVDEMKNELAIGNNQQAIEIANDIKENSEKINHHGKRAGDIVKGMLQHSRSSTGVKEPTDINALADEYLRLTYQGLRAKDKDFNAEMITDFDNSIGKINIIPQDIGRVLLNLFNNAFYAVNEKAKLLANSYQPIVSVTTKKSENHVIITVSDNGNGIPQKIIDKIFQPFFTTKPTGQGTGLGLSLSYDIIKAHGGELKVGTKENEARPDGPAGRGTTFIITLPFNA
ncbi:MAG TPA: ATP-binding protein [Hanamia sp.]